jgi:hypothetical protein
VRVEPIPSPGLLALTGHVLAIAGLTLVVLAVWPFRALAALLAELLIRLSDAAADALTERLNR